MADWILSVGNSDVQFKDKSYRHIWKSNLTKIKKELGELNVKSCDLSEKERLYFDSNKNRYLTSKFYTVPARLLGIYYRSFEECFDRLAFPLLDNFTALFVEHEIKIERVYCLLSDQKKYFESKNKGTDYIASPYFQDTVELESIIRRYFVQKLPAAEFISIVLEADEDNGLDRWDGVLSSIRSKLSNLDVDKQDTVYVSYQAGTPAISSAVQFTALSNFGSRAKFLVSNEFDTNSTTIIEGSTYLKGIQIQQAKQLITSGSPGAAQMLIKTEAIAIKPETEQKLNELVDIFNIKSINEGKDDFKVEVAIARVKRALELIELKFVSKNYLEGITLLSAAHETFMKAAIMHGMDLEMHTVKIEGKNVAIKASEYFEWKNAGLRIIKPEKIKKKLNLAPTYGAYKIINQLLESLRFPVEDNCQKSPDKQFYQTGNKNNTYLDWLKKLYPNKFSPWGLLKSIADPKRDRELDLRNRLMHNLRGTEEKAVVEFLLGKQSETSDNLPEAKLPPDCSVVSTYREQVKKPFEEAIETMELPYERTNSLQQQLNDLADRLN